MILLNDFRAEPAELRQAELAAAQQVLESGYYILGSSVDTFEREWAARCHTDSAVGVANGMDAIEISLRAAGIGAGDEVITTAMTAFATVCAIHRAGATPVLADIDPSTAILDLASVARCLTAKTRAIVLVHLYGQAANLSAFIDFCADHQLHLIEDCAQAHLARFNGQSVGSFGTAGAYSFYPTKNLGAIGDAGAIVTSHPELAEQARKIRNYGQSTRYIHDCFGLNSRLDELHAAILNVRLQYLDEFTQRRRRVAATYRAGIENPKLRLLAAPADEERHVYHLFVILTTERQRLQQHLQSHDIQSLIHYPVPMHRQAPCQGLAIDPLGLKACDSHADRCLSIPCHPYLQDADIARVIEVLNAF